jgi:hypothetical protein
VGSADIDLLFLARQEGLIALLAVLPLLTIGTVSRKRKLLLPLGLFCGLGSWITFVMWSTHFLVLGGVSNSWSAPPYRPLEIGPSVFAFMENVTVLALTLWLPAGMAYAALHYLADRRRVIRLGKGLAVAAFVGYTLVAAPWAWFYTMEDTFVAPSFTRAGWAGVAPSMDRADVERKLGPPIPESHKPAFARSQGAECWASHLTAGHFACVWFRSDKAERKLLWYSD